MRAFKSENFLILTVDDHNQNLQIVESILVQAGYATAFALSGKQALKLISLTKPDLILLDLFMPDVNGLEVCQILKADPIYQDIPILFLTASAEQVPHPSLEYNDLLKAFELGAADYITKPFNAPELLARVRIHLELKQAKDELNQSIAELKELATTDPLTGILNRQHLLTIAEEEINLSHHYNYDLSILIINIDHFKKINQNHGYIIGDKLLQVLAKTLTNALRKNDSWGRFNGEEFIGLLPHTSTKFALEIAQRLRQKISQFPFTIEKQQLHITVSIGLATYQTNDQNINNLLKRANEALFEAKNRGRNRVVVHTNDIPNLLVS